VACQVFRQSERGIAPPGCQCRFARSPGGQSTTLAKEGSEGPGKPQGFYLFRTVGS